jgi:hypothetical protein
MLCVGFEPTIPAFERAKTIHALDRAAAMIGREVIKHQYMKRIPVTVAARSKARTVLTRSNAAIVGSNNTQGMNVCVRLFCSCVVLCVGNGLATD